MDPKDIRRRYEALAAERRGWESHWQEIAERVLPRQADFIGTPHAWRQAQRQDLRFDGAAGTGAVRGGDGINANAARSALAPSARRR